MVSLIKSSAEDPLELGQRLLRQGGPVQKPSLLISHPQPEGVHRLAALSSQGEAALPEVVQAGKASALPHLGQALGPGGGPGSRSQGSLATEVAPPKPEGQLALLTLVPLQGIQLSQFPVCRQEGVVVPPGGSLHQGRGGRPEKVRDLPTSALAEQEAGGVNSGQVCGR